MPKERFVGSGWVLEGSELEQGRRQGKNARGVVVEGVLGVLERREMSGSYRKKTEEYEASAGREKVLQLHSARAKDLAVADADE